MFSKLKLCEMAGMHELISILTSTIVEIENATSNSRSRK